VGKLKTVLAGEAESPPPVWLMRQAGRYLPEYREARAKAGSFWNLCMTPVAAAEVTLQPVWRFGLDAAIVFSDILLVPYALGQSIAFDEAGGPKLEPVTTAAHFEENRDMWPERMAPVYETLKLVSAKLDAQADLIGFAGGPWTLAAYMAEGHGTANQKAAKLWAWRDSEGFQNLLDVLVDCVVLHLTSQIAAGATVVQIFDSWAGGLPESGFADWVIAPTKRIVAQAKAVHPETKIIGFPRGATMEGYRLYVEETGVDGVSLDPAVSMQWAVDRLGGRTALQGNLDPVLLVAGGDAMDRELDRILGAARAVPFIANLGHGVLPETPVANVTQFVKRVRSGA
jgi:uroporphyrinogen decarboxylase